MVRDEEELQQQTDFLVFDYNSLIHPCAREVTVNIPLHSFTEEEIVNAIIENVVNYTKSVIQKLNPQKVYIFIDGVAPRAKINQQRSRRYKSKMMSKGDIWNTNKITPGTKFMETLQHTLDGTDFGCAVEINGSDNPGEGEHKMTKVISELVGTVCVYGLDADLIMLSLLNSNRDNIVLVRDGGESRKYTYVSIKKLTQLILDEVDEPSFSNVILDYIYLCMFLGNDFLEHIPSLSIRGNGIQLLIQHYKRALKMRKKCCLVNAEYLANGKLVESVDFRLLADIFGQLSKSEDYYFTTKYTRPICKDNIDPSNENVFIYTEDMIQYNVPNYKQRYYLYYGISQPLRACMDYITGTLWVLGYYSGHMHNNWSWYYPYKNAPFASDMYTYLKGGVTLQPFMESKPLEPIQQLMMVLPLSSLLEIVSEINKELYEKLKRMSGQLDWIYPQQIYIDAQSVEYLWQSKLLIKNYPDSFVNTFL